ncbi:MAG: TerC family protein [Candidatus Omnitrophota bacterium]
MWMWIIFGITVIVMLALDLGVLNRRAHTVKLREALLWTVMWIAVALIFNLGVYLMKGPEAGTNFFTAYLLEKSLSMDNIFVFLLLFTYFKVEEIYQHKVLFWGIIGAVVFRGIFILMGVVLIQKFHWIIYVFGAFLVITGIRMFFKSEEDIHPEKNPMLRLASKLFPTKKEFVNGKFFVRENGIRMATPLFIVLLVIESMDIVFAVDSIPAVFGVTYDPFIVFSSNIFAILGLRALYFVLAGVIRLFEDLHYGLALILFLIGVKMLVSSYYKVPTALMLIVIALILVGSILVSLMRRLPKRWGTKPRNTKKK